MSNFETQGYSISKFDKEKNGDRYIIEYIEDKGLLLAAVADGVSNQPCDWLASKTTCAELHKAFMNFPEKLDIPNHLKKSILEANKCITSIEGQCHNMASTLSVVVWDSKEDKIYYANIGDSRIYSLTENGLEQLTSDDSVTRQERVHTPMGSRVIPKSSLTKVMGKYNIEVTISEKKVIEKEVIILASDGFYEARQASFSKKMMAFWEEKDFALAFNNVIRQFEMMRGDDMTVAMVKRK